MDSKSIVRKGVRVRIPLRALLALAAVVATLLSPVAGGAGAADGPSSYLVSNVRTKEDRSAVARTGAGIDEVQPAAVVVRATAAERDAIAALGFPVDPLHADRDFPAADAAYHNYAETLSDLDAVAQAHPATVHRFSIGSSYEGRDLAGVRISDDAADSGSEPAVLLVGMHHAREHLTVEVVLSLVHLFAESTDPAIQSLVATRQIYLIPMLNPDGAEFDVATGSYVYWRKNRQPNAGSSNVGTDLNRNYGYRWGCCGGSSGDTASETYRGTGPFSAPESDAMRRFVEAHPNIRTGISYHSASELVLYPYGYTYTDVPADMSQLDHNAFVAMAGQMGSTTGYTPQQSSDLYITDGDWVDWMYGARHAYPFTVELSGYGYGFYPPASFIPDAIAKNRDAAVYVVAQAACPVRAAPNPCKTRADLDGDGRTDIALYRPSTGVWFGGGQSPSAVVFGAAGGGDAPVPADYDGDGNVDQAVFRPSTGASAAAWYLNGSPASSVSFGVSGDIPVPGDYNGDGKAEPAVYRPSTGVWYIDTATPSAVAFGAAGGGDIPVPGDYNGDGKAEPAVFRPSNGTWYVGGPSPSSVGFGLSGDVPAPGDYDGDGKTEPAVFRPSTGAWFTNGSVPASTVFGSSGDVPAALPWAVFHAFF